MKIKQTHLDANGVLIGRPFLSNLDDYDLANAGTVFRLDNVLSDYNNGKHHTTINMLNSTIKLQLITNY